MSDADEIRRMVAEVLAEQQTPSSRQFSKREPLVRFSDPEGKAWYAATISRVQAISAILSLLGTIFAGIWASMSVRDQLVVFPQVAEIVQHGIQAEITRSEAKARAEIEALRALAATRVELEALAKEHAVSRAERVEQYNAIQAQLDRIERRLERLGK